MFVMQNTHFEVGTGLITLIQHQRVLHLKLYSYMNFFTIISQLFFHISQMFSRKANVANSLIEYIHVLCSITLQCSIWHRQKIWYNIYLIINCRWRHAHELIIPFNLGHVYTHLVLRSLDILIYLTLLNKYHNIKSNIISIGKIRKRLA